MANLRIVADNAMNRVATLTASSTVGPLAASNLLVDLKSLVHRATSTSVTYTATWSAAETLSCVALPFCNLSPTATIRVRLYTDAAGTTLALDTGTNLACPAAAIVLPGWTAQASASAYTYGGGACARAWFAATNAQRLVVDIVDTSNLQGYVECSRLVAGAYFSPAYNANVGATLTFADTGTQVRSGAGELLTDAGTRSRSITLELSNLPAADRTSLAHVLRGGLSAPLFLSVLPTSSDLEAERDHQLYCKLGETGAVALATMGSYSLPFRFEEM